VERAENHFLILLVEAERAGQQVTMEQMEQMEIL
jgi:hypothetical protein